MASKRKQWLSRGPPIQPEAKHARFSLSRLRHVQSLLYDSPEATTNSVDVVLCILGIDSRYNDGCQELANYLLFDFFNLRREDIERSGYPEETIDDLIFVIGTDHVDVYCNPVNYFFMLPYIAHWPNLHIHCLKEEEYEEDEEAAEQFKIQSFIRMTDGYSTIGIPYFGSYKCGKFDHMALEKWPIVQAFALEGMGGGGFFTMKYEVFDMSGKLSAVYNLMDPVAVELLITKQLNLLQKQWMAMINNVDVAGKEGISSVTEDKVSEPLRSFFRHGYMARFKENQSLLAERYPFILFGTNSCRNVLEGVEKSGALTASTPQTTGIRDKFALHMVCQAVSPRGPISCMRTYFLQNEVNPFPISPEMDILPGTDNDLSVMIQLYVACMNSVKAAITFYIKTLCLHKAIDAAERYIDTCCENLNLSYITDHLKNRKNLRFRLDAYDKTNRKVPLKDLQQSLHIKTCQVMIFDVPSQHLHSTSLGSVGYADTFINSTISVEQLDGSVVLNDDTCMLTSVIPGFNNWMSGREEIEYHAQLVKHLTGNTCDHLGSKLAAGRSAYMIVESLIEPLDVGNVHFYEDGMVFMHSHHGALVIPMTMLTALHFYDGDSPSVVAFLMMKYKPNFKQYLPTVFQSMEMELTVALLPKTEAYRTFFKEVLAVWRDEHRRLPMQLLQELPNTLQFIHGEVQKYANSKSAINSPPSLSLKHYMSSIPYLERFLTHFAAGSVSEVPIPVQDLPAVLNQSSEVGAGDSLQQEGVHVVVTVLGGVPGSGQLNLANTLMSFGKEERWIVIKEPRDITKGFQPDLLQKQLAQLLCSEQKESTHAHMKLRIIVVYSGFTNLVNILQAISVHPDETVRRNINVGAVTVCVNQFGAYMTDRYTLPGLLDQCALGWVNNIVFTGSNTTQDSAQDDVQDLVRAVNTDVALMIAPGGVVTRGPDVQLIFSETAFNESSLARARLLSHPGWWKTGSSGHSVRHCMETIMLQFSQPLIKSRLLEKLNGLKSCYKPFPFEGNVYQVQGIVKFDGQVNRYVTDLPDTFEIMYSPLCSHLNVEPNNTESPSSSQLLKGAASSLKPYFLVFIGFGLRKNFLKDWLRTCARQIPEKMSLKTLENLGKQEIKKVQDMHHLESLPEGWFFNGSHYVSLDGTKSQHHPNLDIFLEMYLKSANETIRKHNFSIDSMMIQDLFD